MNEGALRRVGCSVLGSTGMHGWVSDDVAGMVPSAEAGFTIAMPQPGLRLRVVSHMAATLNIASAILMESTLSFLGLGVQAPAASWGSMLNNAQSYIGEASWLAMFPGILILLTVFSFNVLGDVFRTAFEPGANRDE